MEFLLTVSGIKIKIKKGKKVKEMKKVLLKMVCVFMAMAVLSTNVYAEETTEFVAATEAVTAIPIMGDINNSGTLTITDALMALQNASGLIVFSEYQFDIGDVNLNNQITVTDALMILQSCSGLITLQYRYKVYGMDFGPYLLTGENPEETQITEVRMHSLIDIIVPFTKWIRTFSAIGDHAILVTMVHDHGMKIAVGGKFGPETTPEKIVANEAQKQGLITAGLAGADLLIISNDVLSKGYLTEEQLLAYIEQIKLAAPGVPIAIADSYQEIIDHPLVVDAVDVLIAKIDPYSNGITVSLAVAFIYQKYNEVVAIADGKKVIIEAGWPSRGGNTSVVNEALFFKNLVSMVRQESIFLFYTEVFNQDWKSSQGTSGPYWGLYDMYGSMKSGIINTFDGETVPDNWTTTP